MAVNMPPMDPGTGSGWVASGPESDVRAFVGGMDYLGAPPPGQQMPEDAEYMRQRRAFHERISMVPSSTAVRESDMAGGRLNLVGQSPEVTSQIR